MFAYLPIFIQLFEIFMFIRTFVDLLIFVQSILLFQYLKSVLLIIFIKIFIAFYTFMQI